jgi:hypothetical protein
MRTIRWLALVVPLALAALVVAAPNDQADTQALLDKAIKAMGGKDNLTKYQGATWQAKGKFVRDDLNFTAEWSYLAPDKQRSKFDFEGGGQKTTISTVVNGREGWTKTDNNDTEALEGDALIEEIEGAYSNWLTMLVPLKEKQFTLTPAPESKVGDRPVVGFKVVHKDHRDVTLYFDKAKGLLLKMENKAKDRENDKEVNEEMFFEDYKEVQGTQQPTKIKILWDGKPVWDMEVTDVKLTEKLDDKMFTKP